MPKAIEDAVDDAIDATDASGGAARNDREADGVTVAVPLTEAALAAIFAHARRDYPRECCGVVYGSDRVREARNIQDELHAEDPRAFPRDARTAYHLDVASLLAMSKSLHAERAEDRARLVYHSHCDAGAYFSASDAAAAVIEGQPAYPVDHLVVAVGGTSAAAGRDAAAQFSWDARVGAYVETKRHRWPPI